MTALARIPLARPALIRVLTTIQNSPHYAQQDILTFTGFCSTAEVTEHVWACFAPLPAADKARALATLQGLTSPAASH
jgi:hypothetical protein